MPNNSKTNGDKPSKKAQPERKVQPINGANPANGNINEKLKTFSDYPQTREEANERYRIFGGLDCFPDIAPALLNSADIKAYVKNTGMIFPFDEDLLQSASYKVRIAGKVVYWRYNDDASCRKKILIREKNSKDINQNEVVRREYIDKGKDQTNNIEKVELELKEGDYFDLQPNSIAFVTLEPEFHIPKYLALRFNLKIQHIYKGLLLGTGPLVDPGFEGRLSIPLHNLTNNTYRFRYGDTLITMEFTKLSPNTDWLPHYLTTAHDESFVYEDFKASDDNGNKVKENRDVNNYIFKALDGDRLPYVISSIPDAIYKSKEQAERASRDVEKVKKHSHWLTVGSLIGVFTIVISSIVMTATAIYKMIDKYDSLYKMQQSYESQIDSLEKSNADNLEKIDELNKKIEELSSQINGS